MTDRMDAALVDLAGAVAYPPTPAFRGRVEARLGATAGRRSWRFPRAALLAAVALLVLAAAAGALVGVLPGLRVVPVTSLPPVASPDALGTRLALGTPIEPESVAELGPSDLGTPDEAYSLAGGEVVSLVYGPSAGAPELGDTGVGLLVQVIRGTLEPERIEKLVPQVGVEVTAVTVSDARGFWISGPPHVIRYEGADGAERTEATRLVGDSLVWERDGTLYRIESGLGLSRTLELAETIGP
jgi:hypothetical protein